MPRSATKRSAAMVESEVRIVGGLTSGETLVVFGVRTLREGMKVVKIQY